MKILFVSQIKKWCAVFALVSFFLVAVFSVGVGMDMNEMGDMAPCAFMMGETAICPMGVSQHIDEWAGLFVPISSALILLVAMFFIGVFKNFLLQDSERQKRKRIYARNSFHLGSLHFLARAFSRGILHSRRYKFAII